MFRTRDLKLFALSFLLHVALLTAAIVATVPAGFGLHFRSVLVVLLCALWSVAYLRGRYGLPSSRLTWILGASVSSVLAGLCLLLVGYGFTYPATPKPPPFSRYVVRVFTAGHDPLFLGLVVGVPLRDVFGGNRRNRCRREVTASSCQLWTPNKQAD